MVQLVFIFNVINNLYGMPQVSFWEKNSFFAPQDVIIVGSGFTGLWSALHLIEKYPDYKITVLERGPIPTGASTRNAGFSCFGSPGELLGDVELMGEDNMWKLVEMRYKGLLEIRKYFSDDTIDYDACGGYECFSPAAADWNNCLSKIDWLNQGLENITKTPELFKIRDEKIKDFGFKGFEHLIANPLEAGLQPAKLILALLQKVVGLGVKVLTGMQVEEYQRHTGSIELSVRYGFGKEEGLNFTTNQLLICTNAFTKHLLPGVDIIPNRGQVVITAPIKDLAIKGTFHFDKGYYYFRNVGNRLLLGGARNAAFEAENTTEMHTTILIEKALEDFITNHLLPDTNFTITDKWSGIMAMGTEKEPIVKMLEPGVFCCIRMNGMGVALAPIAAKEAINLMSS